MDQSPGGAQVAEGRKRRQRGRPPNTARAKAGPRVTKPSKSQILREREEAKRLGLTRSRAKAGAKRAAIAAVEEAMAQLTKFWEVLAAKMTNATEHLKDWCGDDNRKKTALWFQWKKD